MAMIPNEITITATTNDDIVNVKCGATICRFNLMNACNGAQGQRFSCGLKYIIIEKGCCKNFEAIDENLHSPAK